MRFGLAMPHYDTSLEGAPASWDGVARVARLAEAAGFSSIWVSDHLFLDWGKYGGPSNPQGSLECWTTLSALAATTNTLRLGSLTVCNDFRSPGLLAKMVASLDRLSGGRAELGLGAGWYDKEYDAAGLSFERAGKRIERLGEAAQIVTRLLSGEEVTFHGSHYALDGAVCRPLGVQQPRPPLWIGGKGDRLLRTVAAVADGWNFSWIGSLATYEERVRFATTACEEIGRDPASLRRSVGVYLLAGRNDAEVDRLFRARNETTPRGVLRGSGGRAEISWDEFRRDRVAGTVSEVVDHLGALSELGAEEVILTLGAVPFQLASEAEVELVGSEIVPVFS